MLHSVAKYGKNHWRSKGCFLTVVQLLVALFALPSLLRSLACTLCDTTA
jgi:hypothetical protein